MQAVISVASSGKFYRLPPDKENTGSGRGFKTGGYFNVGFLAVIPRARMGSESIAHAAEGRMGNSPVSSCRVRYDR